MYICSIRIYSYIRSRVHNIKSERECPTGINSLNTLRQVMMQQAVFTLRVKHFDLEHKSRDTHYTNSAIISIKQGCSVLARYTRWQPLHSTIGGVSVATTWLSSRLNVKFIFSIYSPRVVGATLSRSLVLIDFSCVMSAEVIDVQCHWHLSTSLSLNCKC